MLKHLNASRAVLGAALMALGLGVTAQAQVNLTSGSPTYTQNFDSFGTATITPWVDNSTLANWYSARTTLTTGYDLRLGDGSSNSGQLYNFGLTADPNRALGSIGSATPGAWAWGVRLKNNDGSQTITALQISYTGEQWRDGGNVTPQSIVLYYRVDASPITATDPGLGTTASPIAPVAPWATAGASFDFTSPIHTAVAQTLDGTQPANQAAINASLGVTIPPGSEIMLQWWDTNDGGNDHGLGIDNLTITGTFTAGVAYGVSPTSHAYGSVDFDAGPATNNSVTLTATSTTQVTGVVASGADGAMFSVTAPAVPFTVNAGNSQAITIQFAPTANDGISRTGKLTFSTNVSPATFDIDLTAATPLAASIAAVKAAAEGGTSNSNGYKMSGTVGSTTVTNLNRRQVGFQDAVNGNVATRGIVLDDPGDVGGIGSIAVGHTISVVGVIEPAGFAGLMEFMPSKPYQIAATGGIVNPVTSTDSTILSDVTEGVVVQLDNVTIPAGTYDTAGGSVGLVIVGATDSSAVPFDIEIKNTTFINYTSDGNPINLRGLGWQAATSGNPLTGGDGYKIMPRSNADFMAIVVGPASAIHWMNYE